MEGPDVTRLLKAWSDGDPAARDELIPLVYHELHRQAAACLRRERRNHTLQPTDLVNEVYLRLAGQSRAVWHNRAQFLAVSATMMRRILVDHARSACREERACRWVRMTLSDNVAQMRGPEAEILDLNAALERLSEFDRRRSRIAELRFFGGLSLEETSRVLGLSVATVERDWQAARAWLYAAMRGTPVARDH